MKRLSDVFDRWRVAIFRAVAVTSLVLVLALHLDIVHKYVFDKDLSASLIVILLILMLEILLHTTEKIEAALQRGVWLPHDREEMRVCLVDRLPKTACLDIICSSSESFFYDIEAQRAKCRSLKVRLLLRRPLDDATHSVKLQAYVEKWRTLCDKTFTVDIRLHSNSDLRCFLFDDGFGLLGFYLWNAEKNRFEGHSVAVIPADTKTSMGRHLLRVYRNRFQYLWDNASDSAEEYLGKIRAPVLSA
jgi:hypothetical protein